MKDVKQKLVSKIKELHEEDAETKKTKIELMGKVFLYTTQFFHTKGFIQLMPVMLGRSVDPLGPDPGSTVVKIPQIEYQGEQLSLTTSMILHKQVAVKDFKKIFIMSPNIRLESSKRKDSGRHLFEFTQADFEIAGAKTDDVLKLLEDYYSGLSKFLSVEAKDLFGKLGVEPFMFKPPFARHTVRELEERYGEDWEHILSLESDQPTWVLSHKREFYDKDHPTDTGEYLNYDIIYPYGFGEGISGAEREHEYDVILRKITRDSLPMSQYERYLSYAKEGLVPSAGAGIGMERLTRFLTRSEHVGQVCTFKRVPGIPVDI